MSTTRKAKVYLQIADRAPRTNYWSNVTASVVNATNSMPDKVAPGCIVIPVVIEIPVSLWAEYAEPIKVMVPEDAELPTAAYIETAQVETA
jgi:hypothetical protein